MTFEFLILYLILIGLVAVYITAKDKINAKKHRERFSENLLLFVAVIGGSIAMFLTMFIVRHKTKHAKFMFGIPAIIILQLLFIVFILERI